MNSMVIFHSYVNVYQRVNQAFWGSDGGELRQRTQAIHGAPSGFPGVTSHCDAGVVHLWDTGPSQTGLEEEKLEMS